MNGEQLVIGAIVAIYIIGVIFVIVEMTSDLAITRLFRKHFGEIGRAHV